MAAYKELSQRLERKELLTRTAQKLALQKARFDTPLLFVMHG